MSLTHIDSTVTLSSTPHTFHIPVMGLAFTIDSPIKVARFGISSVMSIIEDRLIEMMRKRYYEFLNENYQPISTHEHDYRAKRITDYLNLVNRIVKDQMEKLRASEFKSGSELSRYFEMLPPLSTLKTIYYRMLQSEGEDKKSLQNFLKRHLRPGSIDVNIMTKLDGNTSGNKGVPAEHGSDAVAALRGYAQSGLTDSAIIFSAGLNPRLFNYLEMLPQFESKGPGEFDKRIIIKVSDYRSALIQGKYLAKKGIWVSEFRIESGLNCGGHAFATDGFLMGPILEEFKTKRSELISSLHEMYNSARAAKGKEIYETPHPIKLSAQGGIGTAEEDCFLRTHYGIDSTGWGTPFLLCPEATTVDEKTLALLSGASQDDVILSNNSPLGVRFHYLKGTTSEAEKLNRIASGKPGSPCTEKHLAFNTEFSDTPICTASHKYQTLKVNQLQTLNLTEAELKRQTELVYDKECLCVGLSNSASIEYKQPFLKKLPSVTICPGPNIAYFSKITTLKEMTDHIYGRLDLLNTTERPHMFINELHLYINYLEEKTKEVEQDTKFISYGQKFANTLMDGIAYYKSLAGLQDDFSFQRALAEGVQQIKGLLRCFAVEVQV